MDQMRFRSHPQTFRYPCQRHRRLLPQSLRTLDLLLGRPWASVPMSFPSSPPVLVPPPRSARLWLARFPAAPAHNVRLPSAGPSLPTTPAGISYHPDTSPAEPASIPQAGLPGTAVPSAVQIPFARRRCLWECPFLPAHGPSATNSLAGADFSSILHNCSSDKPAAGLPVPATWPAPDSNARNRTPSANIRCRCPPRSTTCNG